MTFDELRADAQCVLNFQTVRVLADQPEFQSDAAAKRLAEWVLRLTAVDHGENLYLLARSAAIG